MGNDLKNNIQPSTRYWYVLNLTDLYSSMLFGVSGVIVDFEKDYLKNLKESIVSSPSASQDIDYPTTFINY